MKKLITVLTINSIIIGNVFANNVEQGIINVLGACAQPPNRTVNICSDKSDIIKIELYKVGLDVKTTETFGNLCLMVCLNPSTFPEVAKSIRKNGR